MHGDPMCEFELQQMYKNDNVFLRGDGFSRDHERFETYFFYLAKLGMTKSDLKVLDVGCGPGPMEEYLNFRGYKDVTALDYSHEGLKIARSLVPGYKYIKCNIKDIKAIIRRTYDLMFCCQVLEHVPGHFQVIRDMYKMLNPGGVIVLSVPFGDEKRNNWHCNKFFPEDMKTLSLTWCGVTPLVVKQFGEGGLQLLTIIKKGE